MQLANPSITSPRQGDRSRANRVSVGNRTGQIYAQQHAEAAAKKAAANLDIEALKRQYMERGYELGYAKGLYDGWNGCVESLVEEGILAPDDEDETDEPEDAVAQ